MENLNIMSRHLVTSAKLVLGIAIAATIGTPSRAAGLVVVTAPKSIVVVPMSVLQTLRMVKPPLAIAPVRSTGLTELHRTTVLIVTPKFYSRAISLKMSETPTGLNPVSRRLIEKQLDAPVKPDSSTAASDPQKAGTSGTGLEIGAATTPVNSNGWARTDPPPQNGGNKSAAGEPNNDEICRGDFKSSIATLRIAKLRHRAALKDDSYLIDGVLSVIRCQLSAAEGADPLQTGDGCALHQSFPAAHESTLKPNE
jgi:hypothetical protein